MQKFYFTFGTSEKFPFCGGWVEVHAPDYITAIRTFRAKYPDITEGILNCSDVYTSEQFNQSKMANGNLGTKCHGVLEWRLHA